jgi:hypothetical protein
VSAESARDDGAPVLETESSPRNRLVDWGRRRAASRMARRLVTLAAVVLVVLAGATIAYLAMRPSAVAMLTRTANCQWESTIGPIIDGAIFREGDVLHLVAGRALVNFAGGARVVLEGPTVLTVETPSSAVLTHGAITADAPSHAVGFTVDMPLGRLVDLGTEFTLRVKKDQSFELQVFDGLVELYVLDDGRAANDAPLRVSEGVAVKVDAATRKLEQIDYDATQKLTVP